MAMLLSAVCAFASCKNDKKKGDDINYDIDLSQKPNLSILMPNSGKSVDAVNSSPNALLIESPSIPEKDYADLALFLP